MTRIEDIDWEKKIQEYVKKAVFWGLLIIVGLVIVFGTLYTIPAGYGGVLMTFGKVEPVEYRAHHG